MARDLGVHIKHTMSDEGKAVTVIINYRETCTFWFEETEFTSENPSPEESMAKFRNVACERFGVLRDDAGSKDNVIEP